MKTQNEKIKIAERFNKIDNLKEYIPDYGILDFFIKELDSNEFNRVLNKLQTVFEVTTN